MTVIKNSAGGIVVNLQTGKVAITNQNNDSWSLPKGHVEESEDQLTAAKREIQEETGLTRLKLIKKLGEYDRAKIAKGGNGEDATEIKHICFFLFTTEEERLDPEDETHPQAIWVPAGEVTSYLTHPKDREFFDSVRHEIDLLVAQ